MDKGSHFLVLYFLGGGLAGGRVVGFVGVDLGEVGGGRGVWGVWGEGVEWVVKVVGVRSVEGVVVRV